MKPQALWPLEGEVIGKFKSKWDINGRQGETCKVLFFFDKRYGALAFKVTPEFWESLPPVDNDGVYPEHKATLNFGLTVRNNAKQGRDGDAYAKMEPELQFISGAFEQPRSALDEGLADQLGGDRRKGRGAATSV